MEFLLELTGKVLVGELWRVVFLHEPDDLGFDSIRAIEVAPEPLGHKARDTEHPEVNEDADFGIVVPLYNFEN